jgi:sugar lactone lactonase YvrE
VRGRAADSAIPQVATPQLSLAPGTYSNAQSVSITDATPGATIYYTTNGTFPSTNLAPYSGAITISTSTVIIAIATAPGYAQSYDVVAGYFISTTPSSFFYTLAGNGTWGHSGDGGAATLAQLNGPSGAALDSAGNLYIADSGNNVIRKVAANTGIITTIAGDGVAAHSGDGGPASSSELWYPGAIAIDGTGNIYISETGDGAIRRIDAGTGTISTSAVSTNYIWQMTCDGAGNLYVAGFNGLSEIAAGTGTVTTISPTLDADGIAIDSQGNLYVSDLSNQVVSRIAAGTGTITTIAGVGQSGSCASASGDGGPATSASLCGPGGLGIDGQGNLYIADTQDDVIREVNSQTGIIKTIAGIWRDTLFVVGDGYPGTFVGLPYPQSISVDGAGNVYLANTPVSKVQKITAAAPPPTITTPPPVFSVRSGTYDTPQTVTVSDAVPGAALYPQFFDSQSGPDTVPTLFTGIVGLHGALNVSGPLSLAVTALAPGYLPSASVTANYTITAPPPTVISTVAGGGSGGFSAAGGSATSIEFGNPRAIARDAGGNLYIADYQYSVVWKQDAATGNVSLFAGNGTYGDTGDTGPATSAELSGPVSVAVDASGNVYIGEQFGHCIREVSAGTGVITTIAGPGSSSSFGDGGPATQAYIYNPAGLATDVEGNLYIADANRVRMISAQTGIISTVAGGASTGLGDGGPATQATVLNPQGVVVDPVGNLYIADQGHGRIRMVSGQTGVISTVGGNGDVGTSGDGGPASGAEIDPYGVAIDAAGNVYTSDGFGEVRKISQADGTITLYAGDGYAGHGGDGASATNALVCDPQGLVMDAVGSLYIADSCNARIRKVTVLNAAATPVISLAGGTYMGSQSATITDATAGATIYYTTDGTTPTTGSTVYSGAIAVTQSETLKAIAVASGYAASAVVSATYTINTSGPVAPTVTVTPALSTVSTGQVLAVTVTVSGGAGTATGTVTLASGSYTSGAATLSGGSATITIPAGSLSAGTDTLTATYTPDSGSSSVYTSASATAAVTVTAAAYTMSATGVTVTRGGSGTSTVTLTSTNGYAGTVTLSCAVTTSPAGAADAPTCSASQTVTLTAATTTGSATVTVNSTAASASVVRVSSLWKRASGGAALAAMILFVVPRRKRWAQTLMALTFMMALGCGLVACGGSGGNGGGTKTNPPTNPGTTAGTYTITVTGRGNDSGNTTVATTFALTVN